MLTVPIRNIFQHRSLSYKKFRTWYAGLIKPKPTEPPYNHIIQIGDPTLRTEAEDVPVNLITSPEIKYLIKQMKFVLAKYNCVGLSATQIGTPLKVMMFEFNKSNQQSYSIEERRIQEITLVPLTVVINPVITVLDYMKITFPEACESVRGFHADVPRFKAISLKGFDENGDSYETKATGWLARIIQHEVDHLNGKLYTDIMDRKTLVCSCWELVNERQGKVELPYGVF